MTQKYSAGTLTNQYMQPMSDLEKQYPGVVFVYMTGHVDIWDDAANKAACQAIRDYCRTHGKVLYDFNDIERYDPDGVYYPYVNNNCDVYSGPGGAVADNWAPPGRRRIPWARTGTSVSRRTASRSTPIKRPTRPGLSGACWPPRLIKDAGE